MRISGAFAKFSPRMRTEDIVTGVRGLERPLGEVWGVSPEDVPHAVIGKRAAKIGKSTGLTYGRVLGYSMSVHCSSSPTCYMDFLVQGADRVSAYSDAGWGSKH